MICGKDLPREIKEMIFWAIDCPLTAQHYFEQVLVGEQSLSTRCEFFRFVMTGQRYKSMKKLEFLRRQDIPDEVFIYKYAQRSLFCKQQTSPQHSLLIGELCKLRLTK